MATREEWLQQIFNAGLCYVEDNKAYFTTQDVEMQWGDDWDDAPYEHNAGRPYEWSPSTNREPYHIYALYYEGVGLREPCDDYYNSPYSVQEINQKRIPWLRTWDHSRAVLPGLTLKQFMDWIRNLGGTVYLPTDLARVIYSSPVRSE